MGPDILLVDRGDDIRAPIKTAAAVRLDRKSIGRPKVRSSTYPLLVVADALK